MDTYLEKVTLTVTSSTGTLYAVATSTKAYSGYIASVYMYPYTAGEPLAANSSSYWQLKADSTAGRSLCRSSSGAFGTRYWYPRHTHHYSTDGTQFGLEGARVPICNEKICCIKVCGNTSAGAGTTEGANLTIFVEGVHP